MPPNPPPPKSPAPADLLSEAERDRLLAKLHRTLVWVGVQDPDRLEIDADLLKEEMARDRIGPADLPPEVQPKAGTVDLRHLIGRLIHDKGLSEKEEKVVKELIEVLKAKEAADEERLKEARLTREEAHWI
ncbi:hypothetical protein P0O15_11610 [Methanotrichaceae archaeon Mx]|uniref:Uncharacterized protein n=2 Tax=Candidatus Methanocrinis natronophilus TaxID=3033396 RepID=A0ABT5XAU9_9EURY|nr:hypothetical protein [Candidatus Methanocrinis natronophilus]